MFANAKVTSAYAKATSTHAKVTSAYVKATSTYAKVTSAYVKVINPVALLSKARKISCIGTALAKLQLLMST